MAFIVADRVQETSTSPGGTGTINLAGAIAGFKSFATGVGTGNTTYYCIVDNSTGVWEVGTGTYTTGSPNTLSRTTVYSNSSGTTANISFTNGNTLTVFCTYPATRGILQDNAGLVGVGVTPVTSKGTLQVGTIGYTDTGVVAGLASSVAGYNQIVLQNTSNNAAASTNFNISNDAGTTTTNYGELGINSSAFTGTGSFSQAGNVYLAAASTDLVVGTYGANAIRFVVNSGATDALTISSAGALSTTGNVTLATAGKTLTLAAGTTAAAPLVMTSGTSLTSPVAGAIEFDGSTFFSTDDVTDGRGYIPSVHFFRLTSDGSAITTIANFFGGTSAVSLDNNIFYEVEAYLYFTTTGTGTATFTMTFSNAPVNNNAFYVGSPVGGVGTAGTAQTAAIVKSTATAGALPATGSLTAATHRYVLRSMFQANATTGGTIVLRMATAATNATPLTGSYFKVTRLPATNTGAFS